MSLGFADRSGIKKNETNHRKPQTRYCVGGPRVLHVASEEGKPFSKTDELDDGDGRQT